MSDLVGFLNGRFDEDETDWLGCANAGEPGPWSFLLDDIEAKRQILTEHRDDGYGDCSGCGMNALEEMRYAVDECPTKRFLALPYDRHPDYQEEWRP